MTNAPALSTQASLPLALALAGLLGVAAHGMAVADVPAATTVYQVRSPDGRVVLTDRPPPSLVTERTWTFVPPTEDERADAMAARDAARRDAQVLDERLAHQLAQQRALQAQLELERLRAARAQAQADAAQARAEAAQRELVLVPVRPVRHGRPPPPFSGWIDEPPQPARERPARLAVPR